MIPVAALGPELLLIAQALGLADPSGNLDPTFFEHPLRNLESLLSSPTQRDAVLAGLDMLVPPATITGLPADEKWHPLLGAPARGNLYLTVKADGSGVVFGLAGVFSSHTATPAATLRLHLPLLRAAGASLSSIAGTTDGPLDLELRVELGWSRPANPIGLRAVSASAHLVLLPVASAAESLVIMLEQLQLEDAQAPRDTLLDPTQLGDEAVHLILGLVREGLSRIAGPTGEVAAVVNHLLPLLGFGADGIPPFPFADLASQPGAFRRWLSSLVTTGGSPPLVTWLTHLAGLFGSPDLTVHGAGTPGDPWRVQLVPLGAAGASTVDVTFAAQPGGSATRLLAGLEVSLRPAGPSPRARLDAGGALIAIPLAGTGPAAMLPEAHIVLRAPGLDGAAGLVAQPGVSVQALEAGLRWNGTSLQPLLELDGVVLAGSSYPRVDLTNADSVVATASSALQSAIADALGAGPGRHLAALAGLVPPAADLTSPHRVDPAQLMANPSRAMASFHRAVLLDSAHPWSHLLEEVAALAGVAGPVSGAGTSADPWHVALGTSGPLELRLAAWNPHAGSLASDPQALRVGLELSASGPPVGFDWLAELLAFDLPQNGAGVTTVLAGQHARLSVQPVPVVAPIAGASLSADRFEARMDWTPGVLPTWFAGLTNVSLVADGTTVTVPALGFPAAAGFDVGNPAATAAALGVSVANLELLLRALLARAALAWGGMPGYVLSALVGLHRGLADLPMDWPTLADPSGPGSLLSDPLEAGRAWLAHVAVDVSASGEPFLPAGLDWLRGLLSRTLPPDPTHPAGFDARLHGSGTFDDPWALPFEDTASPAAEGLVWLEPAGPPPAWAAGLAARATSAADLVAAVEVLQLVAAFVPDLRSALAGVEPAALANGLAELATHLATSDGVVPVASQVPSGPDWTAGTPIHSAHHLQPADPAAIAQTLAQIDAWAGGIAADRAVLLLGPAFSDHSIWSDLLASPARHGTTNPAAHFNLRIAGVDPTTIDLAGVTTVADYYTADLADDGSGNLDALGAQIGRLIGRMQQLRPGVPVTLVAHSTAGVAARAFAASATAATVRGLVTIGSPHLGASLPFLTDPLMAAALRTLQALLPPGGADPTRQAIDHLVSALDGVRPAVVAGDLPTLAAYPVPSFAGDTTIATNGRPALAIGGALTTPLLDIFKQAIGAQATSAAAPAVAPPAPTHVAYGLRTRLGYPPPVAGEVVVDATLRVDVGRIGLQPAAPEPARPAHAFHVRARLSRAEDWLAGTPGSFAGLGQPAVDVRVRWAELGVDLRPSASGLQATPILEMHQAAYRGPLRASVGFADAQAQALLGAILHAVAIPTPAAGSSIVALLADLQALGIAVPDPHGGVGIAADAFAALGTDAVGFLAARLAPALNASGGLGGLNGPAGGAWHLALPGLALEVALSANPWTLHIRTSSDAGLPLGDGVTLRLDGSLQLPAFVPHLDASFGIGSLALNWSGGALSLALPCLSPIPLLPAPSAAVLHAALNDALPAVLFSTTAAAALQAVAGSGVRVGALHCFFKSPGQSVTQSSAVASDGLLDGAKIGALLEFINTTLGLPAGPGLNLPGGLRLAANGSDPLILSLSSTARIGGVIDLALALGVDRLLHPTPSGAITLTISPLPGGTTLGWTAASVTFGASAAGPTLSVTPQPGTPIEILPHFSGLGSLAGAAAALLPAVLDAVVSALRTPGPPPALLTLSLDVASALGVYDAGGGFAAHSAQLRALTQTNWTTALALTPTAQAQVATRIAALFSGASPLSGTLPGAITASGQTVTWTYDLATDALGSGTVSATLGWDSSGPTVRLDAAGFKPGSGALAIDLGLGYVAGALTYAAAASVQLQSSLGLDVAPKLRLGSTGTGPGVQLLPLATHAADGPLTIDLAPAVAVHLASGGALAFAEGWLLPLVASLLLEAARADLGLALWTGGPTVRQVLLGAHLIDAADHLAAPVPHVLTMVSGAAATLASGVSVNATPTLHLKLVDDGGRLGVQLNGHQDFETDSLVVSARFGAPAGWGTGFDAGAVLYVFDASGPGLVFRPGLKAAGLGLGVAGKDEAPLVNTHGFRLGGVRGYLFFDVELAGGLSVISPGAGIELDSLGLPLAQATGGNVGGNNPVVASLLRRDQGSGGGDAHAVDPGVDVEAWQWQPPVGDGDFHILLAGKTGRIWIGVHSGFGPLYIDQVGIELTSTPGVALLIDGSVKVDGFTAQADELTVLVPLKSVAAPSQWTLDLHGLAIGFQSPGVTIAGGLLKSEGPPVEYDGMLLVELGQFGMVAVGSYATPGSGGDTYTSLFVFAAVFIPIGLPPIIEISGLGLGVGYNRQLVVPEDMNQIPGFILVAALDDPGRLANDPMGALMQIRGSIPPRRGSFWLAAGLRGTSFEIVHVTAIVYVALDRGVEIGLLGVARMALPTDDSALVSLELALKVRFSSAEGILSIQAQLTDNSWLLSHDCQLTGGFAYFMWFPRSQFVLTIGGYNPAFAKPPEFPDVPRLGYHWSLLGAISIKGESYFALTNTCVMAGARFEAIYGPDWIHVWFTAYSDFLIAWDPFHYEVDIGISIGATFRIEVCFFGCVHIDITVSLGASLQVSGPPLHGTVTVDLAVASVTVAFGPDPNPQPDFILDWGIFATKYLYGGNPNGQAVAVHALTGLLPPDPAGAQPSPGTENQPWKMASEFAFQTETRMPATASTDFLGRTFNPQPGTHHVDVNPMNKQTVTSGHRLGLEGWDATARRWTTMSPGAADLRFVVDGVHFAIDALIGQFSEATWSYIDPSHVPAGARTIPALSGLKITGVAVPVGESALIPIGKLVDDGSSRPLPFEHLIDLTVVLKQFGTAADVLSGLAASAGTSRTVTVAGEMLSGNGFFAAARASVGLTATGLPPMSVRALNHFRSAPPLITPLATGLTMEPVNLPAPPVVVKPSERAPVALDNPRLRAVLQSPLVPVADAPPSVRTTVTRVAPRDAARMAAPATVSVPGARLERIAAPNAPAPTGLGRLARTLRHPDFGWSAGVAHSGALQEAESGVLRGAGATLGAGATHVWDLPAQRPHAVNLHGSAGARVTFLTRGGGVLDDRELLVSDQSSVPIPAAAAGVAIGCLGTPPDRATTPAAGFAALSFGAARAGAGAVCGWQSANMLVQVGSGALLARGACVVLSQPTVTSRGRQPTTQAVVRALEAVGDLTGVETWLPLSVGVVMVLLDQQDPTAAAEGDLSIAADGATLVVPPARAAGGRRKALLYDVVERDPKADHLVVAVASRAAWRVAGVVGLPGRAQEWAVRLNGNVSEHLVPDGPLTPDGQLTVRFE